MKEKFTNDEETKILQWTPKEEKPRLSREERKKRLEDQGDIFDGTRAVLREINSLGEEIEIFQQSDEHEIKEVEKIAQKVLKERFHGLLPLFLNILLEKPHQEDFFFLFERIISTFASHPEKISPKLSLILLQLILLTKKEWDKKWVEILRIGTISCVYEPPELRQPLLEIIHRFHLDQKLAEEEDLEDIYYYISIFLSEEKMGNVFSFPQKNKKK